jgi:hypothetical protein
MTVPDWRVGARLIQDETDKAFAYPEDVIRLTRIVRSHGGLATPEEVDLAWSEFSESMAAGWMMLYEEDERCWLAVRDFLPSHKVQEARELILRALEHDCRDGLPNEWVSDARAWLKMRGDWFDPQFVSKPQDKGADTRKAHE